MYLTKLELDPRDTVTRNWLSNPYRIHQRLWMGVPADVKAKQLTEKTAAPPFLYRVETVESKPPRILVQSAYSIDWGQVFEEPKFSAIRPETKVLAVDKFIIAGRKYRFNLLANPTQKKIFADSPVQSEATGHKQNWKKSKKVGIYSEAMQLEWLTKKSDKNGFKILQVMIDRTEVLHASKGTGPDSHKIDKIHTVTFSGLLEITEAAAFEIAFRSGIGSAKAFGCGLISLAPAN